MRKLLLVFALIAIVACADLNQELNKLLDEIRLQGGVDWTTVWNYVKRVGCNYASPVCCAVFPTACNICKAVLDQVCYA